MTDTKLASTGNVRIWFGGTSSMANPLAPTAPEINAMLDISDAVSWNDFDFGIQASNTTSDPAITAKSAVSSRGASQYGGSLSFYYPQSESDTSNLYKTVYDALRIPGTNGFIVMRIDGEELTSTAGTASNPGTQAAANDLVHVFKVESAGWTDSITGEDAFRYIISFLSKGQIAPYTVVRASATAPTVAVTPTTLSLSVGTPIGVLAGTVNTRKYTRGLRWTSSNPAVATVSKNGVVKRVSAGSANITATFVPTGTTSTAAAITVT